jgi:hypothetical protein
MLISRSTRRQRHCDRRSTDKYRQYDTAPAVHRLYVWIDIGLARRSASNSLMYFGLAELPHNADLQSLLWQESAVCSVRDECY